MQKDACAVCVECCGYTSELFTHFVFQSIKKKAFQRKIKESPWHSLKTVFGTTVPSIGYSNQFIICVIFGVPHLAELSLMAGVKQTKFW